jgi:molecular chaperone DnaJ
MAQDLYEILGVSRTTDKEEIRKKYKKLARRFHPDVNPGDKEAERRFKEINAAYAVLSDDEKRKLYDEFGDVALQSGFDAKRAREWKEAGARGGPAGGFGGFEGPPEGFDWTEAVGGGGGAGFEDLFGDLFSGLRGGRRGARRGPEPGEDVEAEIEVDFLTAIRGGATRISLEKPSVCRACDGTGAEGRKRTACPTCHGTGHVASGRGRLRLDRTCPTCGGEGTVAAQPCHVCGGSGQVVSRETIEVKIPAGVREGQRLRLAGLGAPGGRGAPPGDLYVRIKIAPHPLYRREGDDLYLDVPITIGEAVRGATISIPTPSGDASFKVPPGTQTGRRFRLRGLGIPVRNGTRGDLYARVAVQVPPASDSADVRELADRLDKFYPSNVRANLVL